MDSPPLPPLVVRPKLAADLNIGGQVVNWTGGAAVKGHYDPLENANSDIPDCSCHLLLYTNGIQLVGFMMKPLLNVHFSQLLNVQFVARSEIHEESKSVIKRAVVGGLILGPLGAVVGGISGIGTKRQMKHAGFIIVNYWGLKLDQPASLLVAVDKESDAKQFCRKVSNALRAVSDPPLGP